MTWATSVPISVFLGLSVLELGPMYATDRQTSDRRQMSDVRQKHRLMRPPMGAGHNKLMINDDDDDDDDFAFIYYISL